MIAVIIFESFVPIPLLLDISAKIGKQGQHRYPIQTISTRTRPLPPLDIKVESSENTIRMKWTNPDDSYDEYKAIGR